MKFLVTYTEGQILKTAIFINIGRIFWFKEEGWLEIVVIENMKGKQEKFNLQNILKIELIK